MFSSGPVRAHCPGKESTCEPEVLLPVRVQAHAGMEISLMTHETNET